MDPVSAQGKTIAAVEFRLNSLDQLFNSFDPSPFHEKELDAEAEEYIVSTVDELPLVQPVKVVIHLPADQIAHPDAARLAIASRNHFARGLELARRQLRFHFREGRATLLVGLVFLFACMTLRQLAFAIAPEGLSRILAEGLLILGWVAMWRPLQIFLYDWWPLRHRIRLYAKLTAMPVELRLSDGPGSE
jgi:hypothetical protein